MEAVHMPCLLIRASIGKSIAYWLLILSDTPILRRSALGLVLLRKLRPLPTSTLIWQEMDSPGRGISTALSAACFIVLLPILYSLELFLESYIRGFGGGTSSLENYLVGFSIGAPLLGSYMISRALFVRLVWRPYWSEDPHCRICGYIMRGNTSGICPECGVRREDPQGIMDESSRR